MNHIFTISNETIIGILIAIIIILFLIILFWNPSKQNKATKNIDELFDKTNNKTLYKTKKIKF